jgi:hypothetical protein
VESMFKEVRADTLVHVYKQHVEPSCTHCVPQPNAFTVLLSRQSLEIQYVLVSSSATLPSLCLFCSSLFN